ncbi:hypothetical protein Phi4:1_gp093 [Cellulophaga phage phi4:1]|uniref:Uncharacterized protein n=5 Tax=Lightbulbvirus TaxID=1918522 RepID=A0A0S2MWL9_9CAUD|nr:hypothetical protein Phi4:1_gp093 [Cellulophaga phage phi4:1]YP_008241590.1 hypothetical protein Phi17:2_gp095 [Cellulophaga phage phi17:2]ALO80102.1 hypothetical protein Phi4113_093 [Cellulophaga phage phi4:1_13]ALO80299.1 hypothetical protein Phi4118_093 [Cellulophaga phage phi4:1_18]ALO80498.1 hypothetical protein Phi17218_095 [Cellulophaga phage phi17:2_18]AGO47628.1 hypothetical protein Phi17:2_gp095 [Cellulophaga phage phi17:2]AGO49506.1 hypothetical protein Phi4:1_gp093 [Cellulophag
MKVVEDKENKEEKKDYTKYTFEDNTALSIDTSLYAHLLQGMQKLVEEYEYQHDKYKVVSNLLFAYLQKEKVDENNVSLKYSIFEYCNDTLKGLFDKELITLVPLKFDIVNTDTDKVVAKKVKGKNYKDVFSVAKTASSENLSSQYLSANGQVILRMLDALQGVYIANVDLGNGITLEDLAAKTKETKDGNN